MALTQHFSAIDKAILVSTGNSLVVCGSTTAPDVNTSDLIKTDGTTTRDWSQSGSTANLNILSNSTILYAELVWYSTVYSNVSGSLDLRSIQDNPITFATSKGSYQITPQYTDSYTGTSGTIDRYRAADVTTYVQSALSGSYTVASVPISVPRTGLSNSRAGWSLTVIYRNDSFKPQQIIYESGISVATPSTPLQTTISGFTTPSTPSNLKGNVFIAAANGEPLSGIESVSLGPSFAQLSNIGNTVNSPNINPGTAPNNPGNNFFAGIINVADQTNSSNGLLNINGTNGTNNNDGFAPIQTLGGRNKWDITDVDISSTLIPNQTLLAGQITEGTVGDGVQLVALGAQVLAQAPDLTASLMLYDIDGDGQYNVEVGEQMVYGIQITNNGSVAANNVMLSTVLDQSCTFVTNSVVVNGTVMNGADITKSVNIGSVPTHGIVDVTFTVIVNKLPSGPIEYNGVLLYETVNYSYQFTSGQNTITNYDSTNTVQVIVQEGLLSITKSASTTSLSVGDTVTYTININNIGSISATNILFQDKVNQYCSFVDGSLYINGTNYPDDDPTVGVTLPDMNVGASTQIVFESKVNSLSPSTKVNNLSCVSFGYIYNQYGYLREQTIFSNSTSIQVNYVDVIGERCNSNNYPNIGDTVTYTLSLSNIGNESATNVQVQEPPIPGVSFVTGSVKINGTSQSDLNPFTGFTLTNPINPQQTTTVTYQVLVNQLNPANTIENIAQVPFKYQISQGSSIISSEKDSNKVDTIANYVCMNISKSVDKAYASIGDTLYYTINVSNSGNINATNTMFLDSLQSQISLVSGSVYINGVSYPNYDPTQGFTIGTICPSEIVEITFKVTVNSVPNPNIVYNHASLLYNYQPDPNASTLINTVYSNTVQTTINQALYTITKSVNKTYAQLGDILVYTTTIQNTGTVHLTNIIFADYIGAWMNLYPGTVYVNGVNYPSYDPSQSFSIEDLHPGEIATIVFATTIVKTPPVGYIPNMSEANITYQVNPTSPVVTKTIFSNTVVTYDPLGTIDLVKSVDKSYSVVGDTLTYSFTATNTGNTTVINTLFNDTLQAEATFATGSVMVNGISQPSYDPNKGFTLGTIYMGQVVTVSFQATINKLPNPNVIKNSATTAFSYYVDPSQQPVTKTATSNTVTTTINSYSATLTKSVDKLYATIGDTLNYTVTVNNTGTVSLTNVNFIDIIANGATFVPGSVYVNGVNNPSANPNTGFSIGNISAGGSEVITFQATVTTVPTPPTINNTANMTFVYQLTPTSPYVNGSLTSNIVTTNISMMSVTNTKSVDKAYATVGDTLTYTSVIANNGNINITNTNFIDNIPSNTTFVKESVKINGTPYSSYDPTVGFTLETITPGSSATIVFEVTVASVPSNGYVTNTSNISYQYQLNPNLPPISANVASNSVTTYINMGNLTITKAADRSIVKLNNVITYNFVVTNTGNTNLTNLSFKDTIQGESSFNTGSVYINGVNQPSLNLNNGFSLSDIPVGQQTTISFTVTANSIPLNNELLNTGSVTYSYHIDPKGSPTTKTATSNQTTVYVYDTIMSANKSVDKSIAKIGDTLNFTINVSNEGNVSAKQVLFEDILDLNISFVTDSVYINGNQEKGYDPNKGFSLQDIEAGSTTTVTFEATVKTRPANNIVYNYAVINYEYTVGQQTTQAAINTNTTQTYVAVGELTIAKSVDKIYATVGDNLSYSVTITNTGSVNATKLAFQDLIPNGATFNTSSVVIDGISQSTFNPNTGFNLSDLIPNQSHTVVFSVNVSSLPASGEIDNTADVTFTYQLTPSDSPVTTTTPSNTVKTYIEVCMLNLAKVVDKSYATIGDTLNYSITINNTGNANATNIVFKDMIQSNATFVSGSVKINGTTQSTYDPNKGFILSDIPGYGTTTVTFAVTVQTLPTSYIIYNAATTSYSYYINPNNPIITTQSTSNTVTTMINIGLLTATKSVSKAYATVGDILTYTVNIVNTGNVVASSINFRDVIPTGLTFVTGSVTINGTFYTTYDPYASFTLGNISPGATVVVTFNAAVASLPTPSLVSNTANITFSYYVNPSGSIIVAQVNSNTVTTQINVGTITLTKSVDKSYSTMGNILTYTVVINNTGNVDASNVIFTDNLQMDVTFNEGSVIVNGKSEPTYDPTKGFIIGTISTLGYATVSFTVTVIPAPTQSTVLNFVVGTFSYKVDPNGQYYSNSVQSNTVSTIIVIPSLTATKVVDKAYATIGDTLNYNVSVQNTGNTTISQLFFTDFLSNGAVFKSGTLVIDGVSYQNYDPTVGFNLPNSLIAGNTSLVQFQATVTALPSPPQVTNYALVNGVYYVNPQGSTYPISATSNTVTTNINLGSLSNTKTVDKMYASVNDTVTYTSTITNTGNINATSIQFIDSLQSALTYVSGTVTINGVVYPSLDPTVGFSLSDLAPGQTVTVVFSAKINSLPTPPYVTNTSSAQFSYYINPNTAIITKTQNSNTVTTNVVLGKINTTKAVDKPIATLGDILTYTVTLTNVGNVIDNNVLFQDTPSTGVTFNKGSVTVNGTSQPTYDPTAGFSLGNIGIGNVVTVIFTVTVKSVPSSNQVTNQAIIPFQYVVDPKQNPYSSTSYSNTVTTNIAYGNLSVNKSVNKQFATIGDTITYTVVVTNVGNINATNVVFLDPTPQNSIFVLRSVTINGVAYPDYNPSAGFNLNTMTPGQIITVVYQVQVIDLC
ncbi:DUF7507 domain-containing protein [Romboutsia lituseburensis]|uniref:DUF7507 domain-containing protein n=1 Tax=Romboutsia lituseburensis TaxID=1537 RepID=UPI00215A0EF2|nr:hypothetical protein [Romboutsia lituseburensis]MCR8746291.1 hypothetical protein [Romboutsia lituseburensis]